MNYLQVFYLVILKKMRSKNKVMTKLKKNLMLRVIKKRLDNGENIEDIFADYPKLTDTEKSELKDALGIG